MEKKIYSSSDTNFCAYLMYLGYKVIGTNVIKKENGKVNVSLLFEGKILDFNIIYKNYKFNQIEINLSKYIELKDEAFKLVKAEVINYDTKQKL